VYCTGCCGAGVDERDVDSRHNDVVCLDEEEEASLRRKSWKGKEEDGFWKG
jgi:hypothetical protein